MDRFFGQCADAHGRAFPVDDLAACLMKKNDVVIADGHGRSLLFRSSFLYYMYFKSDPQVFCKSTVLISGKMNILFWKETKLCAKYLFVTEITVNRIDGIIQ